MNATLSKVVIAGGAAAALLVLGAVFAAGSRAETVPVADLSRHTHIHGLAVDGQDPPQLLIATHHGLFSAGPDGRAERVSEVRDFMGFNAHPGDPDILYASGHPAGGGNLGFIVSTDRGRNWRQVSPGVDGPVDFHQMTVSPADPATIYGAYAGGLQASRDSGESWTAIGPAPDQLIDLAASARAADTLYAATGSGLLVSRDAGRRWQPVVQGAPVSLVEIAPDGALYAFVLGRGLARSAEEVPLEWQALSDDFGGGLLLHLAADPADPDRLFAATGDGEVLSSTDGGKSWRPLGSGS